MGFLRTKEAAEIYRKHVQSGALEHGCVLCDLEPLKSFALWKIIPNEFPYDRIAETHHMIVPLRHVDEDGLNRDELEEFRKIKEEYLQPTYEYLIEATHKMKSIPAHFHLHLIVVKD